MFSLNADLCHCGKYKFCDAHHKHIRVEDLRIKASKRLRKVFIKNLKYRKPRSIYFNKAYFEIDQALQVSKISIKKQIGQINFYTLERITMVKEKNQKINQEIQPK